jgi:hypothetical protein
MWAQSEWPDVVKDMEEGIRVASSMRVLIYFCLKSSSVKTSMRGRSNSRNIPIAAISRKEYKQTERKGRTTTSVY